MELYLNRLKPFGKTELKLVKDGSSKDVSERLLAASEGVGFLMVHGRQLFQLDMVMASMVVIGVTGWLLDRLLQIVERRLLAWRVTAY